MYPETSSDSKCGVQSEEGSECLRLSVKQEAVSQGASPTPSVVAPPPAPVTVTVIPSSSDSDECPYGAGCVDTRVEHRLRYSHPIRASLYRPLVPPLPSSDAVTSPPTTVVDPPVVCPVETIPSTGCAPSAVPPTSPEPLPSHHECPHGASCDDLREEHCLRYTHPVRTSEPSTQIACKFGADCYDHSVSHRFLLAHPEFVGRPHCLWGEICHNMTEKHRSRFQHPDRVAVHKLECKWGARCYDDTHDHRFKFGHPYARS
eukprot:NODE_4282_length_1086_cov_145.112150_g4083_i0.p1 GENE.NODE_4282_length_1086_cov_145.112150_g4083_i0~~NODE_4282_length_1086_cov_145.112150_g4083_i0.p1  ORF type:complete len:260 (+),score=10.51 NODE_4282_length_1086_cov_145.112150_g4083_i0:57-836(+)